MVEERGADRVKEPCVPPCDSAGLLCVFEGAEIKSDAEDGARAE